MTNQHEQDDDISLLSRSDNVEHAISIEEAIGRVGYGPFQQRILVASGLCSASDAMEILLLSFLSFSVQVEWQLTNNESNCIISIVFVGAFIGTLLLGRIGDVCGRKPAFVLTASMVAIFGLATSFCQNYTQLLIARFMVGIGLGGITVPFDTYAEFLPTGKRGPNLVLPSYFWTTGTVLTALLARVMLGQDSSQWRMLCVGCSIPCFLATVVAIMVVPESPRWLLLTNNNKQQNALSIFRLAAHQNGKDSNLLFPEGTILLCENIKSCQRNSSVFWQLLSPAWYQTSLTIWLIWMFYASLYYGTILVISLSFSSKDNTQFHFDYGAILTSSLAEVFGTTLLWLTIDRFGRRHMYVLFHSLGGVMVLFLCLCSNKKTITTSTMTLTILAFLARGLVFSGSALTWIWTAELFPTEWRSTGHSVANACARIGGFVTPYLVGTDSIGWVMMAISLFMVGLSRRLPETTHQPMGYQLNTHDSDNNNNDHQPIGYQLNTDDDYYNNNDASAYNPEHAKEQH